MIFIGVKKYIETKLFDRFHATSLFLYPLKISGKLCFFDVFRGCKKKPLVWNGFIWVDFNESHGCKSIQIRVYRQPQYLKKWFFCKGKTSIFTYVVRQLFQQQNKTTWSFHPISNITEIMVPLRLDPSWKLASADHAN